MFAGIVQGMATLVAREEKEGGLELVFDLGRLVQDIQLGASVAIGGACLTVTEVEGRRVCFYVMVETLRKTVLGGLKVGELVNIERSVKVGDEIGGHLVSGHIAGVVTITKIDASSGDWVITFGCDPKWIPYLLPKGFVALDGCSLTVVAVGDDWFTVHFIPETLQRTTFGFKKVGHHVNLELDAMTQAVVDTVKRVLSSQSSLV